MHSALAAAPIAVALLMILLRCGTTWSAVAALLSAVAVWLTTFPAPVGTVLADQASFALIYLEIALILLGGVVLSRFLSLSGAQARLGHWVMTACRGRARSILLVVLGIVPFAESVTGFGIGIVVAVPLLVQLGFSRVRAAVLGLLGLIAVPWGALAPRTLIAARLTGVGFSELGSASALLSVPVFIVVGAAALFFGTDSFRQRLSALPELLAVTAALAGGIWVTNVTLGTPLAGVLGSSCAIAVCLGIARIREGRATRTASHVAKDVSPYGVLVAGLLASRVLVALLDAQGGWTEVVTSPALWLITACAMTPLLLRIPAGPRSEALRSGFSAWHPVALTTVLFLVLGTLLTTTGMSAELAHNAARLGEAYPGIAPWIGALSGFVTGSTTGANAMFVTSQAQAAQAIGFPVLAMVTVQSVAASLATMASVPRVALAIGLVRDIRPAPSHDEIDRTVSVPRTSTQQPDAEEDASPAVTPTPEVPTVGQVLRTVLAVDVVVLMVLSGIAIGISVVT